MASSSTSSSDIPSLPPLPAHVASFEAAVAMGCTGTLQYIIRREWQKLVAAAPGEQQKLVEQLTAKVQELEAKVQESAAASSSASKSHADGDSDPLAAKLKASDSARKKAEGQLTAANKKLQSAEAEIEKLKSRISTLEATVKEKNSDIAAGKRKRLEESASHAATNSASRSRHSGAGAASTANAVPDEDAGTEADDGSGVKGAVPASKASRTSAVTSSASRAARAAARAGLEDAAGDDNEDIAEEDEEGGEDDDEVDAATTEDGKVASSGSGTGSKKKGAAAQAGKGATASASASTSIACLDEHGHPIIQHSALFKFWDEMGGSFRCGCATGKAELGHMLKNHWNADCLCPLPGCNHREKADMTKVLGHLVAHKRGEDEEVSAAAKAMLHPEGPMKKATKEALRIVVQAAPPELFKYFKLK